MKKYMEKDEEEKKEYLSSSAIIVIVHPLQHHRDIIHTLCGKSILKENCEHLICGVIEMDV